MKKALKTQAVDTKGRRGFLTLGIGGAVLLTVGFGLGWLTRTTSTPQKVNASPASCLHLDGATYTSPLLLCDTSATLNSPNLSTLQTKLQNVINDAQAAHSIDSVSVYFRDLTSRDQTNINGQAQYYPASLNKVPVLMAYYKEAESNPAILATVGHFTGTGDYNAGLEIQPAVTAHVGQDYTINDLINLMIKDSDNNSFETLASALGDTGLKAIYQDLQIQYPNDHVAISDYITPYQFSLFLRTLYNSTFLSQNYSEEALKLMTEVDFKDGLVKGVPTDVAVAHKFGIATHNDDNGKLVERELHDCGIIYAKKTPYILCVMTKGSSSLVQGEKVIQDLSAAAYQEVANGYK